MARMQRVNFTPRTYTDCSQCPSSRSILLGCSELGRVFGRLLGCELAGSRKRQKRMLNNRVSTEQVARPRSQTSTRLLLDCSVVLCSSSSLGKGGRETTGFSGKAADILTNQQPVDGRLPTLDLSWSSISPCSELLFLRLEMGKSKPALRQKKFF